MMPQGAEELSPGHKYACRVCPTSFARREHLNRHMATHLQTKSFRCPVCDKGFARKDVRNKHVRSHEEESPSSAEVASKRACKACSKRRVRCSRESPCKQCIEKSTNCIYPSAGNKGKRQRDVFNQQPDTSLTEDPSSASQLGSDATANQDMCLSFLAEAATLNANLETPRSNTAQINVDPNLNLVGQADTQYPVILGQQTLESEPIPALGADIVYDMNGRFDAQATKFLSINWISQQYQASLDPFSQLGDIGNAFPTQFLDNSLGFGQPTHEDLTQSAAVNPQSASDPPPLLLSVPRGDGETQSLFSDPDSAISRGSHGSGSFFYVDGDGSRASLRPVFRNSSATYPPATWRHERSPGALAVDQIPVRLYQRFANHLQTEFYKVIGSNVPSYQQVSLWVNTYFEQFHPSFPFLRRPRFWEDDSDWLVLLAVAAVGTSISNTADAAQYRHSLIEILQQMVSHRFASMQGRHDSRAEWISPGTDSFTVSGPGTPDLATLQASVLSMICLMHGGKNEEISLAMAERSKLVDACHAMRLLSNSSAYHFSDSARDPEAQCQAWYQHQALSRVGLMIWLLDFFVVCEFHCRPLLQLADVIVPLPCNEIVWDSKITDTKTLAGIESVPVLEALEMLYMEKKLVPDISEFGKLILIYGICRRTKEVCLRSQSQLMSWTPSATIENRAKTYERGETWPPSSNLLSQWRNSACDCLDILHWSANSTALGQWGWEHPTIFHLHLSRLLILTPLRHIQTLATPSPSQDATSQPSTERHARAREYVLRWYLQDQYKARLSVIHAGALLWHCRRYSTRVFLEPYAIYVAALVLWAYSISLKFCQSRGHFGEPVVTSNNTESPNMDNTPASNPTPQPFPEAWDQATTDAMSVIVYLDRPIDDELVQTYIRWGHKMTACLSRVGDIADASAPGSILKEAQRLLNLRDTTRTKDHSANESSSGSEEMLWGVRSSFSRSLESLIRATQEPQYGD
ncbi:hypothetical protein BJ166DRAFT_581739 [Pestalotiopsis sp. NC0098]|nr:hypothetical protein BJ166DRAFT_581739 [Pestalotiopsis sp. NC0098]